MVIAVTLSATDSGTTSETPRLSSTIEIPAACTDTSSVSSKLKASLKHPEIALTAADVMITTTGKTDVASMMAEDSGVASMIAGDFGIVTMTG